MSANQINLSVNDIAQISGVSRSTVSRVLMGHPNVKETTRQRVLGIIEEYNFKPNPAARALVLQRTHVMGILIPHVVSDLFSDPFFPILIQAITTTANQEDYSVMLLLTSSEAEASNFYGQVLSHPLYDGLVISSAVFDYPLLKKLDERGKPYIIIGRPNVEAERLNYLNVSNEDGGYMMVEHLIKQGRRRIGFIPGLDSLTAAQDRMIGYMRALQAAGMPIDRDLIAPSGYFKEQGGYDSMKTLLHKQVDAVFAASDMMASGAIRAIQEAGLKVPDDIAVGGFDDMPFAAVSTPSLTTIRQPITNLGIASVRILVQILEGEREAPYQEVFPVELVIRSSTVT